MRHILYQLVNFCRNQWFTAGMHFVYKL